MGPKQSALKDITVDNIKKTYLIKIKMFESGITKPVLQKQIANKLF